MNQSLCVFCWIKGEVSEHQRGNVADPDSVTFAAITAKPKRERVCKQTNESDPDKTTYTTVAYQRTDRGHWHKKRHLNTEKNKTWIWSF